MIPKDEQPHAGNGTAASTIPAPGPEPERLIVLGEVLETDGDATIDAWPFRARLSLPGPTIGWRLEMFGGGPIIARGEAKSHVDAAAALNAAAGRAWRHARYVFGDVTTDEGDDP